MRFSLWMVLMAYTVAFSVALSVRMWSHMTPTPATWVLMFGLTASACAMVAMEKR